MQDRGRKELKWHLPMKDDVLHTIDASIYCKQNFQDMSKYLIKKVIKDEYKRKRKMEKN